MKLVEGVANVESKVVPKISTQVVLSLCKTSSLYLIEVVSRSLRGTGLVQETVTV